ncbi:DUF5131 family protein [Lacunimicrobium album]
MSVSTKIQWCDSTCNPTMGCDGCELWSKTVKKCYAGTLHVRFGGTTTGYAKTFDDVTLYPGRMADAARWTDLRGKRRAQKPWLDGMPRLIFVSDMSDALSKAVTFEFLKKEVIDVTTSALGARHQWLWLTKRPERMAKFSQWLQENGIPWPRNLWAGTSVTSQKTLKRIQSLSEVGDERTIRFLSVEPQHEQIDLREHLSSIRWVIQGGESGARASAFELNWARTLISTCQQEGVSYFLKQLGSHPVENGERIDFQDSHAGDWAEWEEEMRVREFPKLIEKQLAKAI